MFDGHTKSWKIPLSATYRNCRWDIQINAPCTEVLSGGAEHPDDKLSLNYPADKSQKNLKGQSTQVIWIENYNCIAVAMGPKNQTYPKCSLKELATVVCALRTIVTTCTKNDYCHHVSHKTDPIFLNDENSWPPSCLCDEVGGHNNLDDFVSIWRRFLVLSILETAE